MSSSRTGLAAAAGVAGAVLGAGAGELIATMLAPVSSPFAVIGGALIDAAPTWAKDTAIAWFGTSDKAALLVGIGIVLLAVAAAVGIGEERWRRSGVTVFAVLGVAVGILALTRPDAGSTAFLPSVLAGATAAITLRSLLRILPIPLSAVRIPAARNGRDRPAAARTTGGSGKKGGSGKTGGSKTDAVDGPTRRRFLTWAVGTAAVGVMLAAAGSLGRVGSNVVTTMREALKLPRPASPAPAIPASASLDIEGLAPVITPNAEFYRIDTAIVVPTVDPASWQLRIHGMVAQEVTLTWDELLALPLVESVATLSCVSNEVGGDLVGNAVWLGYPIRELLARAAPDADADMVLSTSAEGFTAGTPLEALTDERAALLAIGMNGQPLPLEHGFPVRMVVPGLYGYVSATKWVIDLEVTRFDRARAYWTDRGWSERGPIKLQSRIDVPRQDRAVTPGDSVIAGVAWQPGTGIAGVEVQIDDGEWRRAELATAISDDTWVQWHLPWRAASGEHRIRCRAIADGGTVQTDAFAPPAPDGASGWHTIAVSVA